MKILQCQRVTSMCPSSYRVHHVQTKSFKICHSRPNTTCIPFAICALLAHLHIRILIVFHSTETQPNKMKVPCRWCSIQKSKSLTLNVEVMKTNISVSLLRNPVYWAISTAPIQFAWILHAITPTYSQTTKHIAKVSTYDRSAAVLTETTVERSRLFLGESRIVKTFMSGVSVHYFLL